jgi:hypothetical protein
MRLIFGVCRIRSLVRSLGRRVRKEKKSRPRGLFYFWIILFLFCYSCAYGQDLVVPKRKNKIFYFSKEVQQVLKIQADAIMARLHQLKKKKVRSETLMRIDNR